MQIDQAFIGLVNLAFFRSLGRWVREQWSNPMSVRNNNFNYFVIGAYLLLSTTLPAFAEEPQVNRWFSISIDNDMFTGTDGGYTNGLYASWFYIPAHPRSESEMPWYFKLQAKLIDASKNTQQVYIHNISQTMLTPTDIRMLPPDPNDSPYAGLLFWQGSLLSVNDRITDFSSLMLGVLGPASLAEQSQKTVHKVVGADRPLGWDYQLGNEPVVGYNYGRFWRLYNAERTRIEFDTVVGINGMLGNLLTALESVAYMRIGGNLESSYPMVALSSNREINPTAYSGGWFAYVGVGVLYPFHDRLFDRDSKGKATRIFSKRFTESLSLGVAVSGNRWGLSIAYTEAGLLGGQEDESQKFGSLTFLKKLN